MEIKSIKEVQDVGIFVNFTSGASLRFEKLTFIYGLNSFGKTTLTDIFQSLKNNNGEIISSRKTIPNQNMEQKVRLGIQVYNEEDLIFQKNAWGANNIAEYLEIFGTDFIHKNLFTGLFIQRENKENFTQFILGEEGVKLAEQIEIYNKTLGDKKRNLKNLLPNFVQGKGEKEIKDFLGFSINGLDKMKIEGELTKLKGQKQEEEKRLKEPQKILGLDNVSKIVIPEYKILNNIENINILLQKDYTDIKEELLQKLDSHINGNFIHKDGAENWLKQGFQNVKDKSGKCIFCGQGLENAIYLIELYSKYFDEGYSNFISEMEEKLKSEISNIKSINFGLLTSIQAQYTIALKYKDLIIDEVFQKLLIGVEEKIKKINESKLNGSLKSLLLIIEEKEIEKGKKPYKKIEGIDYSTIQDNFKLYVETVSQIIKILEEIESKITDFKQQYEDTSKIQEIIAKIIKEIEKLEYQKIRIEQDYNCIAYLKEKKEITTLSSKITTDTNKLDTDQNTYLQKYFKEINELFKKFGSHNFILEKEKSTKGYKPVYSLKVKFHNVEIEEADLEKVFSESDRRALALAIFWAKFELKEQVEKEKSIIILDDPITSFDNERTKNFIDYLNDYNNTSQLIILTHYSKFLSDYYKFTEMKPKVYQIVKGGQLDNFDYDYFLKSDYLKYYEKIMNFINGGEKIELGELRSFIDKLYSPIFCNIIPEDVIIDCQGKCNTYNHNTFTDESDIENFRNFTKEIFEKLYSFEFITK